MGGAISPTGGTESPDNIGTWSSDDAGMNRAIEEARRHVQVFERELAAPQAGRRYSVKKAFPTADGMEHMWLVDVKVVGGGFEGVLDNDPRDAPDAVIGRTYMVKRDEISDWLITDDQERIWGGYTIRAHLATLPEAERRAREAQLQPLPE